MLCNIHALLVVLCTYTREAASPLTDPEVLFFFFRFVAGESVTAPADADADDCCRRFPVAAPAFSPPSMSLPPKTRKPRTFFKELRVYLVVQQQQRALYHCTYCHSAAAAALRWSCDEIRPRATMSCFAAASRSHARTPPTTRLLN